MSSPDTSKSMINKATVAVLIREHEVMRKKENEEKDTLKTSFINELRGVISSQIVSSISSTSGSQKRLLKAGVNANVSRIHAMKSCKVVAEHCTTSFLEKLKSMGTKDKGKSN